jgi:hypothetical protein
MFSRLALQARYASELLYKLSGYSPEVGQIVFKPDEEQPPELWKPVTVKEVKVVSGALELVTIDHEGLIEVLGQNSEPYAWADMNIMQKVWSNAILTEVKWPKKSELFVVDSSTTMNYVPKCRNAIKTGLCYNTVISEITDSAGNQRYTGCPYEVEHSHECQYPTCLGVLINTPQVSITAAKAAFRSMCAVALFGRTRNQFLYLTNGNHHLNLVTIEEGINNAWYSGYLKDLMGKLDMLYQSEDWEHRDLLLERLSILEGEELTRWNEAEALYPPRGVVEDIIDEARLELGDNVVLKKGKK